MQVTNIFSFSHNVLKRHFLRGVEIRQCVARVNSALANKGDKTFKTKVKIQFNHISEGNYTENSISITGQCRS